MSADAFEQETIFTEFGVRATLPRSTPAGTRCLAVVLVSVRQQSDFNHRRGCDPQLRRENAFHWS